MSPQPSRPSPSTEPSVAVTSAIVFELPASTPVRVPRSPQEAFGKVVGVSRRELVVDALGAVEGAHERVARQRPDPVARTRPGRVGGEQLVLGEHLDEPHDAARSEACGIGSIPAPSAPTRPWIDRRGRRESRPARPALGTFTVARRHGR